MVSTRTTTGPVRNVMYRSKVHMSACSVCWILRVSVNTTPHTSHFLVQLHAHAWLKSCVCSALSSLCSPSSLLSSCPSSCPSTSSSRMWWTNSLCTLANEDLRTLAEYDSLTVSLSRESILPTHFFEAIITVEFKLRASFLEGSIRIRLQLELRALFLGMTH